jgi:hypothetical protein
MTRKVATCLIALVVLGALDREGANATTLTQSYNNFVSGAGTVTGTFNLPLAANEYVTSATLSASFADDSVDLIQLPGTSGPFIRISTGPPIIEIREAQQNFEDPLETARLSSGGESSSSSSSPYSVRVFLGRTQDSLPGLIRLTDLYRRTSGFTGEFSTSFALSALLLQSLNNDKTLSWTVSADVGDFILESVTLNYDTANAAVPIPAALPLFLTGLGALALVAQRRKKHA